MLPLILTHTPAGTSVKQLLHYAQEILSGHFRKYDYGIIGNLLKYGKIAPPDYELDNITAPVALFYSLNDWFANVIVSVLLEQCFSMIQLEILGCRIVGRKTTEFSSRTCCGR